MGLGKTRQSIVAMKHAAPDGPYLVVCPASVKQNWAREIIAASPGAVVQLISGGKPEQVKGGWVIVNYDILKTNIERLISIPWAGFVFDEAHYMKNHTSQRSRFARQLLTVGATRAGQGPVVHALTGTPLTNRPRDLFPLLQIVDHPLGRSFLSFAKRYCAATHNGFGWVTDGASNLEELTVQLHGVMLRRSKDKVLTLPPKLRTWLSVDVPPGTGAKETAAVVRMLLNNQLAGTAGEAASVSGRSQQNDRLRIIASLTRARRQLAIAKCNMTTDFVGGALDQGEKVLVFSCFDDPLKRLAAHFGTQAVLLTGATPSRQRQKLVDRFQSDPQVRLFVANIQAGGIGLNLTAARQVVFNDLDWVPANHWQAEDRAYRIGQTGTVNITYMVGANSVDEFVQRVLETKTRLVDAVVEGKLSADPGVGNILDELQMLFTRLSPQLADRTSRDLDQEEMVAMLKQAADLYRSDLAYSDTNKVTVPAPALTEDALRALVAALSGPQGKTYRVPSRSKPGAFNQLTVASDGDVTCDCPGFSYRGMCSHARELKQALASGKAPAAQFTPIEPGS
jgi:SWI/SNF-related matrix-associated actin-dependent regulator 1 of chromatin subfamily A